MKIVILNIQHGLWLAKLNQNNKFTLVQVKLI